MFQDRSRILDFPKIRLYATGKKTVYQKNPNQLILCVAKQTKKQHLKIHSYIFFLN